ncbi:MAG: 30S ribosomal protein S27ae [Candidatus Woesearchaeota archaeon]
MADKKQTGKSTEKSKNNNSSNKISNIYEFKGESVIRKNKLCPKCGVFMAKHHNRNHCGKCGYTEIH